MTTGSDSGVSGAVAPIRPRYRRNGFPGCRRDARLSIDSGRRTGDRGQLSVLLNRYVAIAFLLQTLSDAVLVSFLDHGDGTLLVALTRGLPTSIAALLGIVAVPAFFVTLVVGVVVESVSGLALQTLGTGLVSDTDGPFLVAASPLSIGVARVVHRRRRLEERAP